MFETLRGANEKELNHSGRSYVGETMQLDGDLRSSGSIDVAGLMNGNVFVFNVLSFSRFFKCLSCANLT